MTQESQCPFSIVVPELLLVPNPTAIGGPTG